MHSFPCSTVACVTTSLLVITSSRQTPCLTVASPINSLGNFLTIEIFSQLICPVSSCRYHGLSNLCLVAAELSKKGSGADDLLTWTVLELGECVSNLVVMIRSVQLCMCLPGASIRTLKSLLLGACVLRDQFLSFI